MAGGGNTEDLDLDIKNKSGGGSQQKTIILVALIFSVVTLLAVGLTIYFLKGSNEPAHGAHQEAAAEKPKKKGQAHYIEIKPAFLINYMTKNKMRYLQLEVALVVYGEEKAAEAMKEKIPLFKDKLGLLFQQQDFEEVATPEGREKMRQKALEKANGLLAEEGEKEPLLLDDVLFISYVVQ